MVIAVTWRGAEARAGKPTPERCQPEMMKEGGVGVRWGSSSIITATAFRDGQHLSLSL